MTTGIGNSIAIPHCKDDSCPDFVAAMGISREGIDFKAIDNIDVKIVFLLLGPADEPNKHIKLLSRISRIMSHNDIRAKLAASVKPEEAYDQIEQEEKNHPSI